MIYFLNFRWADFWLSIQKEKSDSLPLEGLRPLLVRKAQISIESYLVNFMWCVFHNAQWYWSDNVCKLVTDQWRASLGVRDSESCWFTEEIGTYMRLWESPRDLPLVIEMFVSFRSFHCAPLAKRHKISITRGRSPGLSQEGM